MGSPACELSWDVDGSVDRKLPFVNFSHAGDVVRHWELGETPQSRADAGGGNDMFRGFGWACDALSAFPARCLHDADGDELVLGFDRRS